MREILHNPPLTADAAVAAIARAEARGARERHEAGIPVLPANPTDEQCRAFVLETLNRSTPPRAAFATAWERRAALLELQNYGRQYLATEALCGREVESWVDVLDAIRRDCALVYGGVPESYAGLVHDAAERAFQAWHVEQRERRTRAGMPLLDGDDATWEELGEVVAGIVAQADAETRGAA